MRALAGGVILGVLFGAIGLCAAAYARGAARAAFMVTDREVLIRNPFRTRAIPLSDVSCFTAGGSLQRSASQRQECYFDKKMAALSRSRRRPERFTSRGDRTSAGQ